MVWSSSFAIPWGERKQVAQDCFMLVKIHIKTNDMIWIEPKQTKQAYIIDEGL